VNDNPKGARSLLAEGAMRARGRRLLGMSLDDFADAVTSRGETPSATTGRVLDVPPFPRGWRSEGDSRPNAHG